MTFRTTTLTATVALLLGAGTALAQQETVITVPMGQAATAPEGQDGLTFTATPTAEGVETVATPSGNAPEAEAAAGGEALAQAPAADTAAGDTPTAELPDAPVAVTPAEDAAAETATTEPADAPAEEAAAEAEPAEETAVTEPAADTEVADTETATAEPADAPAEEAAAEAEPAETAAEETAATEPAEEAPAADAEAATAEADVSSDDPAAAVEGDIAVATGDSEAPVEGETDAALGTVSEADTAAEVTEAENQAARTAGENVVEAEAPAAVHEPHITDVAFSFEGPFGTFDQFQLQRGLQVYTEVCSACHGMRYVPLRTLADPNGPQLPEDQVRAYAAELSITDSETGEDRPRLPTDNFPIVAGEGMGPDLSLMAKARAGFHGPYGTGISQLFNGMGGPEYVYSLLTGYTDETKEEAGTLLYENATFAGGWIQMAPPLFEDGVEYADGTPATIEQMAEDVSAFMMWAAEPKLMERKQTGLISVLFLILLTVLLYLTNKRLWWPIKHGRDH